MISIVTGLFTLTILIIVHEYGHYYAARFIRVKVEEFAVGFGNLIYHRMDKFGTKWSLRLLPLGGYVRLFGQNSQVSDYKSEAPASSNHFAFKTVWERLVIVLAGPIANYLFALILIWLIICYHDINANQHYWWQYGWRIIANFAAAFAELLRIITVIFSSIVGLFSNENALQNLGSVITISNMSASQFAEGMMAYFGFLAVLSINLGTLNLLPIPVLDGGHAALLLYEAIAKKPLNLKIQSYLYKAGSALLFFLIVISFSNDIKNALT